MARLNVTELRGSFHMSNNECGSHVRIGTNEGLVVSASDGEIVETTGLVSRVTGYSKAELLAMPLSALFCAAGTDDSDKQVGTALSETDGRSYEFLNVPTGRGQPWDSVAQRVRIGRNILARPLCRCLLSR